MDLKGTEGNDHLVGTADDDVLTGLGGNDTLEGLGGHDELDGGAGNDSLAGGDSYDYLVGGLGDDTLDGGADGDWVYYDRASGAVNVNLATGQVSGADGNDVLRNIEQVGGSAFNDTLVGDAGYNVLVGGGGDDTLDGGAGIDAVAYWGVNAAVNVNLATGVVSGGGGNDRLSNIENVEGSGFDDVIVGDGHDNVLAGRDGNDTLTGGGGADTFVLSYGVDRITDLANGDMLQWGSALARDVLSGNDASKLAMGQVMVGSPANGVTRLYFGLDDTPGADVTVELAGSFSANQFSTEFAPYGNLLFDAGLAQPKTLTGSAGDDDLRGGNGDDSLSGGDGNDQLSGGPGHDVLLAGDGYDYLEGGAGNDTLDGGGGEDWVYYNHASGPVSVNLASGQASGAEGNDKLLNLEDIVGSAYNDVLTGDAGRNILEGGLGDDTLAGGDGFDAATYGSAGGPVNVNLATGKASGAMGNDQLSGIEWVQGSFYADVLTGDAQDNRLYGGGGNDTLAGGGGHDTFAFDTGPDAGTDRVLDLANGDLLEFNAGNLAAQIQSGDDASKLLQGQVMIGAAINGITKVYVGANDTPGADVVVELAGSFNVAAFSTQNTAYGSILYDTALNQPRILTGTVGDDFLRGGNLDDTLSGLGGSDQLDGSAGNDSLAGGDGNDYLLGGLGNDTLDGGAGEDVASYELAAGAVTIDLATGQASGADGSDRLTGIETVYGSAFNDQLTGDAGNNTFLGGLGNDTISGGAGRDTALYWDANGPVSVNLATGVVSGAVGDDRLSGIEDLAGSGFADVLVGDAGPNRLDGSSGADTLSGGGGADTFVLGASTPDAPDLITDLGNGDVLEFNIGELAVLIQAGNDPSRLLAGQVMLATPGNGVTRLYVGADTVPGADLAVDLQGSFNVLQFTAEFASYGSVLFDATLAQPRTVTGTAGNDQLHGGNADDTLLGGDGDDELNGSLGNDLLQAGAGYDYLIGGPGNDTLDGGADWDTAWYGHANGPVNVNLAIGVASGADGNDKLLNVENIDGSVYDDVLAGDDKDNTLQGGLGNDTLAGGLGEDSAVYWSIAGPINVNLVTGKVSGAAGNDQLSGIEDVYGTAYDDVLVGDARNNQLGGSDGNDTISGGAGDDLLYGGAGNDSVAGGDGDDTLDGGDGNDTLDGGAGFDTVTFNGPETNYVITALGPGAWRVEDKVGADGVDVLSNVESLSFVIPGALDGSTLQGGSGYDIASYQTAGSAVTVDLNAGTATGAKGSDTLKSIEGAIGSATFGDTLLGNGGDNQLSGLGGDDKLDGGDGNDKLDGGLGADTLAGGAGADVYVVDDAGDQVVELANVPGSGANGLALEQGLGVGGSVDKVIASINYTLTNFVENLELATSAGNLSGTGNALNNVLNGNAGNNRLMGGGGNDTLDGKDGTDTAVYAGARASYALLKTSSGLTVGATAGDEGTDNLSNIERLKFSDQGLALDMGQFQAGGTAVLLMGATLGPGFTASRAWAGIFLNFFDGGASLLDGASLLVGAGIMAAFAGGADNASFVKFVYSNVNGQAPDAATLAALVAPLNNGATTQAAWMADMALSAANQQHVNLTGLAQGGWAYDPA